MGTINNKDIENFISNLNNILTIHVDLKGGYIYPLDKIMDGYISTDKHLIIKRRLEDYEKSTINFFKQIHSWFPANPSKKETVDRGNNVYYDKIIPSEQVEIFKTSFVNYRVDNSDHSDIPDKHYRLWDIILKNDYIVFLGKKGQGKTAFINYWFNNYTAKLEHSNILWFRVDASKLYGLREKFESLNSKKFDLETYHKIHSVYVYLKYREDSSSVISKIMSTVSGSAMSDENLDNALNRMLDILGRAIEYEDGKSTEKFLGLIAAHEDNLNFVNVIYDCCDATRKLLNYRILFVIDGIDNISWIRNENEPYERLCDEVSNLFVNDFISPYSSDFKTILVLRPETWKDIQTRKLDHLNDDQLRIPEICELAPTCVKDVLIHKTNESGEPKSHYFKSKKKDLNEEMKTEFGSVIGNKKLKKEIKLFNSFSHSYVDSVMKAIKHKYEELESFGSEYDRTFLSSKNFINPTKMLEILFNNNMRACVDNFVENYATIQYALKRGVQGADSARRMPQYLLLNGRIFLDSEHHVGRIRGEAYPNIFWWDNEIDKNNNRKWNGLLILRILQLLATSKKNLTDYQLIEIISDLFLFDKKLVNWSFERMVKYGLIDYSHNRGYQKEDSSRWIVSLTNKGKFILDYIFMYPEWLYFCALDTPIPEEIINDTRLFKIHRDVGLDFITSFNTAFIITTITFTRIINSQHKIDINLLKEKYKTVDLNGVFNDFDDAEQCFKIPRYQKRFLKEAINRYLRSLNIKKSAESKHEACMLLHDLKGVYNY